MDDDDLFDDLDVEGFELPDDPTDREILYVIWACGEVGDLPADEGWALLYERHPTDARLLLLATFEELGAPVHGVWTAAYFLQKAARIRETSGEMLAGATSDLVIAASRMLLDDAKTTKARRAVCEAAMALGVRLDPAPSEGVVAGAYARLAKQSYALLRELHDATRGGRSLSRTRTPAPSEEGYASLVASAKAPPVPYSPRAVLEAGALVDHSKLGVGVVRSVAAQRAEVLFPDGMRKLVCS